jgi:hypothetical protein
MSTTGGADQERAQAVAEAALRQAAASGVSLPDDLRLWTIAGLGADRSREPVAVAAVDAVATPAPSAAGSRDEDESPVEGLASVLEAVTPAEQRRANGLHVTPAWLADELVALVLDGLAVSPDELTICDPACGGGAFLLSAARALHALGVPRDRAVRQLWGADVDPVGLAAAEVSLALWAAQAPPPGHLVVGDPLTTGAPDLWSGAPTAGFGAVVGNPPFLNQLGKATVRSAVETGRLRQRFGEAVQPYTDTAWLFLLLGCELVGRGGRVVLVQPMSLVAARDAAVVREALSRQADLRHLWVERGRSFAAGVKVCAPVLGVGAPATRQRPNGTGSTWADRLADAIGVPKVDDARTGARPQPPPRRLGDRATVLAGFRDEYYGLVPLVREADTAPADGARPLVTAGVIDWGRCLWGQRSSRFAKQMWASPVVDLDRRDPEDDDVARAAARWVRRTAVPKIVVATQTRVVEAAVDETGCWVPSVPTLAVLPERPDDDLWLLAAAVAAPTATAWLLRRAPETGLSRGALKIAARDLADLPLPIDDAAWQDAAAALQAYVREPNTAHVGSFARSAGAAYGAPQSLVDWWRSRLG